MKNKSFSPMGSLHPILFFAVVYVVALLLSIFICSSLFYSFNGSSSKISDEQLMPLEKDAIPAAAATTVAMR